MTKTIMVVDDDEDIREITKLVLESSGYQVVTAATGAEAWRLLESGGAPALILLDMMMPDMDGEQFLRMLRTSAQAAVPVVVVSGRDASAARELGDADASLTKPMDLDDLLAIVARFADGDILGVRTGSR